VTHDECAGLLKAFASLERSPGQAWLAVFFRWEGGFRVQTADRGLIQWAGRSTAPTSTSKPDDKTNEDLLIFGFPPRESTASMRAQLLDSTGLDAESRSNASDPDPDGDSDLGSAYGSRVEQDEGGADGTEIVDDDAEALDGGLGPRKRRASVAVESSPPAMSGLAVERTAWSLARLGVSPPDGWAALFLATSYEAMPGLR
jgi:hypothetical protein